MNLWEDLTGQLLPSVMTLSVRTALPFLTAGVSAGLSANQILSQLRGAGLGINRAAGLTVIRTLRGAGGMPPAVRGTVAGDYPDPTLFTVAAYPTARNYTYIYEVTGTNPFTGGTEIQNISIVSDTLLTSDEADELANNLIDSGQSNSGLEDVDVELQQVKVSPYFQV